MIDVVANNIHIQDVIDIGGTIKKAGTIVAKTVINKALSDTNDILLLTNKDVILSSGNKIRHLSYQDAICEFTKVNIN